jgi:hypothetical protein
MTIAWTRTIGLGLLLWQAGCIISVDDNPNDDGYAGDGGSFNGSSGSGGRSGSGGSAGSSGSSGEAGAAGTGGSAPLDVTCEAEVGDDADPCVQCMKRSCCEAWLACDDQSCADEWVGVRECVASEEFADSETLGMCISASSEAMDGFVQSNTQSLIDCATAPAGDAGLETQCSLDCFGTDIFFQ